MIKGSPSSKRNPHHVEEDDDEGTHVETKRSRIPITDEADNQGTNITIHQNLNNAHRGGRGGGEAAMFHPRIYEGIDIVYHPSYLFEKELWSSDVASDKNRLLVTGANRDMLMPSLKGEEWIEVCDEFLGVLTIDRNGVEYALGLKWLRRGAVALIHEWSKLVSANSLKKGDLVEFWGYRVGLHTDSRYQEEIINK